MIPNLRVLQVFAGFIPPLQESCYIYCSSFWMMTNSKFVLKKVVHKTTYEKHEGSNSFSHGQDAFRERHNER